MTIGRKIKALIQLVRPELPAAAGVCVVVGQTLALGKLPPIGLAGLGFALGFFLSGSAMVFNDLFDLEVDRVNAPQRPLPSGLLTPTEAIVFGAVLGAAGLAFGLSLHPAVFGLSLGLWVLGFVYNWKLKAAGLWGNLAVALNVAMTFILGGISAGQAANPVVWIFGLIAFTFDLAEEIAGDAMDMEGDRKRGSKSLAILHGKPAALRLACLLFVVMILLTLAPLLFGETGAGYLIPILVMDAIILFFTGRLYRSTSPQEGRKAMRALYLCASACLVIFILVRF